MVRIVFRIEGNNRLGMGHTFTPLRIAKKLVSEKGIKRKDLLFIMSSESKRGQDIVKVENYIVVEIDDVEEQVSAIKKFNPNFVFTDVLHADVEYMKLLRQNRIFTINMEHSEKTETRNLANVVINSLYPDKNPGAEYHYGPRYALLSDSYANLHIRKINRKCKRVFVCFGGSDANSLTIKAVKALMNYNVKVDVVVIPNPKVEEELQELYLDKNKYILHKEIKDSSELMLNADIGIVSGGYTCYECAATGLPIIVLSQNDLEHHRNSTVFVKYGTCVYLGYGTKISEHKLGKEIEKIMNDYNLRTEMSKKGQELVDGKGLDRVVDIILSKAVHK